MTEYLKITELPGLDRDRDAFRPDAVHVPLSRGFHVLVSPEDYERVVEHSWRALDCRRESLRPATVGQNARNRSPNKGKKYKGICRRGTGWQARIKVNRREINLGTFDTPEQAALAYNEGAKKYHRNFARLNELPGGAA